MPIYDLFKSLHLFSFVESLHIKFRPGSTNAEACRTLYLMATDDKIRYRFPKLKFSYEITSYDCIPEINITVTPGKTHRFTGSVTVNEIHRQIDQDQYQAYIELMKRHNIEHGIHDEE